VKADYRPDIDGLRAIAVIIVIFFHFGVRRFSGGFIGVDIFFVISGYLITRLLVAAGSGLSLAEFYGRRMRRILPAMLVMIALSLIAGWFLLLPGDYAGLGRSAGFSAAGLGNYYFLSNTGYFDREAALLPLLHLWSLGVEEQFYLAWPALIMVANYLSRGSRAVVIIAIGLVALVSFSIALKLVSADPKAAFYLPFGRAWELAAGGLLVFLPVIRRRFASEAFGLAGVGLIAFSIFHLSSGDPFPGLNALAPVAGALLLVWPRSPSTVSIALSCGPMRFTGKVSYSLYLWHWPVLVFFRHYANGAMPTTAETSLLVAISCLAAYLSWRFVEEPARHLRLAPFRTVIAGAAAASIVALSGSAIFEAGGIGSRIPKEANAMRSLDVMWNWPCPRQVKIPELGGTLCAFGAPWDTAKHHGILWGDSHAEHLAPLLDVVGRHEGTAFFLYRGCPAAFGEGVYRTYPDLPDYKERCSVSRKAVVAMLGKRSDIDLVVLSSAWTSLAYTNVLADDGHQADKVALIREGLESVLDEIAAPDRHIGLIGQVPDPAADLTSCAAMRESRLLRRHCSTKIDSGPILRIWSPMVAAFKSLAKEDEDKNVSFINPVDGMCPNGHCLGYVNGEFIYRDGSHLRRNLRPDTDEALARLIGLYSAVATLEEQKHISAAGRQPSTAYSSN
jgi:peptidoglycan/LPS O-acetylase OafA/YrhL